KTNATEAETARIKTRLEKTENVKSIQYISKEEAYKQQSKLDPEAFKALGSNPLPSSFRVTPENPDRIPVILDALAPADASGARVPVDPKINKVKNARETPKLLSVMNAV